MEETFYTSLEPESRNNQGQCEDDTIFNINNLVQHSLKKKNVKQTIST